MAGDSRPSGSPARALNQLLSCLADFLVLWPLCLVAKATSIPLAETKREAAAAAAAVEAAAATVAVVFPPGVVGGSVSPDCGGLACQYLCVFIISIQNTSRSFRTPSVVSNVIANDVVDTGDTGRRCVITAEDSTLLCGSKPLHKAATLPIHHSRRHYPQRNGPPASATQS